MIFPSHIPNLKSCSNDTDKCLYNDKNSNIIYKIVLNFLHKV